MWGNEQLAECSFGARLLFIGMLNFADDNGLLKNSPKKNKMNVFPADNVDVEKFLDELIKNNLVTIYESSGQEYIWIITFSEHQRVDRPNFTYPLPSGELLGKYGYKTLSNSKIIRRSFDDHSTNFEQQNRTEQNRIELSDEDEFFKIIFESNYHTFENREKAIKVLLGSIKKTYKNVNLVEIATKFKHANVPPNCNNDNYILKIASNSQAKEIVKDNGKWQLHG